MQRTPAVNFLFGAVLSTRRNPARKEKKEMPIVIKTGIEVPVSGQYRRSGGNTESTLVRGETAPPNPGHRPYWTLVDKTRHKR